MAKTYNLKTQIRSALRKVWMYSPIRREAAAKARVARGVYRCATCRKLVGPKEIDVDHVVKVTPTGFDPDADPKQWGVIIENMLYVKPAGLVAICKPCHKLKTAEERRESKIKKKSRGAKRSRPARTSRANAGRKKRVVQKRD